MMGYKIKSGGTKLLSFLLAALISLGLGAFFSPAVRAADKEQNDMRLEVRQQAEGVSADTAFTYCLTAQNGAPLPAGSSREKFYFSITGNAGYVIRSGQYPHPGRYEYQLALAEPGGDSRIDYDTSVYHIIVYVIHTPSGALSVNTVALNAGYEKVDALAYSHLLKKVPVNRMTDNRQTPGTNPRPVRTGDMSGVAILLPAGLLAAAVMLAARSLARLRQIRNDR